MDSEDAMQIREMRDRLIRLETQYATTVEHIKSSMASLAADVHTIKETVSTTTRKQNQQLLTLIGFLGTLLLGLALFLLEPIFTAFYPVAG